MIGFFSLFKDKQNIVRRDQILFVHIPDSSNEAEIRDFFSKTAKDFADFLDSNKVYLNYGKDKFIQYEYSI